ncbi:3D domain-containing protein [Cohnella zeiphila]|uniref:LysM peptidoglycan-binding domain-containing protein n=1 Tax=Cohnella zeiphila TaxID=2761120 RepID=A0A7X0VWL4_9BACL|nr:3D domain-containing protein [Cohnella zeiphila]MBB6732517.1 LysM peptidoglycan-binding domain-containing protein [Cohnella zeiphila]
MANDARKSKLALRAMSLALGGALLLPAVSAFAATSYTATNNDTFWTLSKKFGVPMQKLMDANPKVNPRNIYAGLKLTIPAKATAAAAKPAAAAKVQTLKAEVASAPAAKTVTTSAGQALTFSKVIDMKASAYSSAADENGGWGAVDYFGNPLKLGTIAVDPKVIPLGSKVFIAGYSFDGLPEGGMVAKATDKGSAIVGNRIDIFIPGTPAKVSTFGFQNVKLYVLN